ncbi:MAG: hypothetical protein CMA63_06625 [Euryarchaeota archaeon]|nr:hypothetical protein [Euryarchaeota archaeon]
MSDRTKEEWGALAASIEGWDWLPGMRDVAGFRLLRAGNPEDQPNCVPDVDDMATAGCMLELLGYPQLTLVGKVDGVPHFRVRVLDTNNAFVYATGQAWGLGRACVAAAAALGRWCGGDV